MIHEIPESIDSLFRERSAGRVYVRAPLEKDNEACTRLHYDDFDRITRDFARAFTSLGFEPGDRVGIAVGSPIDFLLYFFGGMRCGLWMAPLDPTLDYDAAPQFHAQVEALQLRAIMSDREPPTASPVPWHGQTSRPHIHFSSANFVEYTPSTEGGILLSSSGTTGTPKVMMLTQRQFLTTATYVAQHNELEGRDVGLNPLPLWHINAEVVAATATAVAGAELILQRRFKRTDFWQLVYQHQVTWINAVPAIVSHLATLRDGETVPSSVRFIRSASAPLPAELITQFERDIGIPVIESYGMTEAASQICANPLRGLRKPGSVGIPVGVELRVEPLVDDGVESPNQHLPIGQIALRGPSVISRYASDDYATRFTSDGWLLTGDLGYLDDDGYVFLVGRSDDVINRSGEKIYPREIEEIILRVDGVIAASVIGVPDVILGSVPLAYIELADGVDDATTCEHVIVALEAALGRSKRPTAIRVVDAFPRHATGKIQKNPLRDGAVTPRYEALLS